MAATDIFVQAIKTGKPPCMGIEVAHRVANMCNLGNLSYILGRKLTWDGAKERFVNDDEANSRLSRPQRKPYEF